MVKHQNMDIGILSKIDKVWAEQVGNEPEPYPTVFDLLNSENQLPDKVGGNTNISADELTIDEVEDDPLDVSVSLSVPQNIEKGVEATFPISTSMESSDLYEFIDLGEFEGIFGSYESIVETDNSEIYNVYFSKRKEICVKNESFDLEVSVVDFDGEGVNGETVYFYESFTPVSTLTASNSIIQSGGTSTFTIKVKDSDGNLVSLNGATVKIYELTEE